MDRLPENIEVIISILVITFAILIRVIQLFARSPIARFLSSRQTQVKEGVQEVVVVSFAFVLVIIMFSIDTSLLEELHIKREFELALVYAVFGMFFVLLVLSGITYWKRPTAKWCRKAIKVIMVIAYIVVVASPLLLAAIGSFDYAKLQNRTILVMLVFLWALYACTFFLVYGIGGNLSPKRLDYRIQLIDSIRINELYMVTALDHERIILAEDEKVRKNQFFTPFYIYNYTTETLHMVERAARLSTETSRKDVHSH